MDGEITPSGGITNHATNFLCGLKLVAGWTLLPEVFVSRGCSEVGVSDSVWRGLDKRSIAMRLSRLSSCSLGSALFLLCSLNTFALPAHACRLCSSATQIPSPLLLLCPGARLPSTLAKKAVSDQLSEQLAHASKL